MTMKTDSIVCISDLHLAHWNNQSPEKDYRKIVQPLKLAERLISVLNENNSKHLFILGDIINTWNEDPSVINVLTNFYKTIITAIPDIWIGYIEGQHDMLIRDRYNADNSYIHLVAALYPNNVHYMHDQYININETSIYCSSYNRQSPIMPSKHVNIFLSHITFGMVDMDESMFDLCVAGDIHSLYDKGKCHSCSPAIPLYAHEEEKGWISVISLKGGDLLLKGFHQIVKISIF